MSRSRLVAWWVAAGWVASPTVPGGVAEVPLNVPFEVEATAVLE